MTDIAGSEQKSSIRLRYKIIAYVATWIIALLLTAPGMWPLAYMFPLGLAAVINRHLANDGGWGVMIGCHLIYLVHGFFLFPFKDHGANCGSLRRSLGSALS